MNWCLETYRNFFVLRSNGRSLREGDWIIYIVFYQCQLAFKSCFVFFLYFCFCFLFYFLVSSKTLLGVWVFGLRLRFGVWRFSSKYPVTSFWCCEVHSIVRDSVRFPALFALNSIIYSSEKGIWHFMLTKLNTTIS